MSDLNDNINSYYSSVDKTLLGDLCKNPNLRTLLLLSAKSNVNVFNKKKNKWELKTNDKILKDCEQSKKKEVKTSSSMLSNLAKLNSSSTDVTNICHSLENKITNIDKMIDCVNTLKEPNLLNTNKVPSESSDSFIECYSNC
jgi:septal ring factor EnvC (AmiA/AmiB activator)